MTLRSKSFFSPNSLRHYIAWFSAKRQKITPLFAIAVLGTILSGCQEQIDQTRPATFSDLTIVFSNIIQLLAPVAAVAFLIMAFVGGFQFLTSGGDQKAVAGARTTLTYAIIGIILVVVSWLILLLIRQITGVDVTKVEIPESQ